MMLRFCLTILLLFCVSCNFNPRCIEADDFGDPKVGFSALGKDVDIRYPNGYSDYGWLYTSNPVSTGYVLNGDEVIAKLDGAWSPWSEERLEATTSYESVSGAERICNYAQDFEACPSGAETSLDAQSCVQQKFDSNMATKICWYTEGVGLYVVFSIKPDEDLALYYHVADYFETTVSGYPEDWYFVIDPTSITYNGETLLEAFGVDDYDEIKIYAYLNIYDDYSSNTTGCIDEEASPEPDKLDLDDGDIVPCSSSVSLTFYQGAKMGEPIYTQAAANTVFDKYLDIIQILFDSFVTSSYLGSLINVSLSIMISYLGIAFFLGLTRFTKEEILAHVLRVGIVFTIVNSTAGWDFYNDYFVTFIWDGSQELASEVMLAVNTAAIETISDLSDYHLMTSVETSVFGVIDDVIGLFLANETHTKIWSIAVSYEFGIFIVLLMYLALIYFILSILKFSIALILVFFTMIILLGIGPIMFVFLLFGFTREYFMKWIQSLFSVFIQPVIFLIFFGPFATLATFYLYKILYIEVCWKTLCCEPVVPLFGFWFIETSYKYNEVDGFVAQSHYTPDYYDILILFIISALLRYFVDKIPEIATKLSGGFSFATSDLAKKPMSFLDNKVIDARNALGGAAMIVGGGVVRKGMIDMANLAGAMGLKSVAAGVKGSKENNLVRAKKNITNTMRNEGYTDAEIKAQMKSNEGIQNRVKEDFTRLQASTREKYTVMGALGSLKADVSNSEGNLDFMSPLRLLPTIGKRAMASYNLSKSKDYRSRKMSKAQREKLSDKMSGTGAYREQYKADPLRKQQATDFFDRKQTASDKKKRDAELFDKDLPAYFREKAKNARAEVGAAGQATKDAATFKATRGYIGKKAKATRDYFRKK